MRRTLLSLAAVVAAALLGWVARGFEIEAPVPHATAGKRNLFAYREPPPRVVVTDATPPVVVVEPMPAVAPPLVTTKPQPQFTYRFLGTFGTRDKRFAAFSRDGEVIAVRPGRRIGSDFVLRSIGVESVEVETASGETIRVAM